MVANVSKAYKELCKGYKSFKGFEGCEGCKGCEGLRKGYGGL